MADIIASSPLARTINLTRTTFSGSIFGGRRPATANPAVQPTERLIDPNEVSLRRVSNQLSSLTEQMNDVGGALERIAFYIAQDTSLENLKTKQEQKQEKQLTEEGIRTRQESVIERKLKSALVAPVQAIAQRAQSVLSRLMQFFGTLLGGWLLMRGIDTLKALSEGNTKKLEEIRDSVLKNLGIAGATLAVLSGGFFGIIGTLGAITLKITKALGKLLILKPFQFIAKLIGDAINNIVKPAGKAAAEGLQATTKATAEAAETVTKAGTESATEATTKAATKAGERGLLKGAGKGLSRLIPFANIPISAGFAYQNIKEGDIPGAAFDIGGMVPGLIGWGSLFLGGAYEIATGGGIRMKPQSQTPSKPAAKTVRTERGQTVTPGTPYPATQGGAPGTVTYDMKGKGTFTPSTPAAQPQTSIAPSVNQFQFNVDTSGKTAGVFTGAEEEQDFSQPPIYGDVNISPENISQLQPIAAPQAQITPMPAAQMQRNQQIAAPLPEPKPTVVMARTSSAQQGNVGNQGPAIRGSANNVPAIPSSNPENFYTLYSQVHYNVVV